MNADLMAMVPFMALAFVIAGTVKGAVGLGLPTTALGIMTLILDPRLAISLAIIPMVVLNGWQVFRLGDVRGATLRYLPFALALMIGVGITVTLSRNAPDRVLFAMLGVAILLFVAVNVFLKLPPVPDRLDRPAQIVMGSIAGILGGMTSVWAPPLALFLAARGVAKDEFVRASGLLIFLGSLPLVAGYVAQDFLTREVSLLSALMLIPALIGFSIGEKIRFALSEVAFKRALMVVFFLMGANLLRRALF